MSIGVIGAGAMDCGFSARLAAAGEEGVNCNGTVVRRGAERGLTSLVNETFCKLIRTLEATFGGLPES